MVGLGFIVTTALSVLAAGVHVLPGGPSVLAIAVSLVLNFGLFWLGFGSPPRRRSPGGNWARAQPSARSSGRSCSRSARISCPISSPTRPPLYGTFALVLGLIAWLYLQAQLTLYAVEINVVRAYRLWPRSLAPPPYTEQDRHALQLYVEKRSDQRDIVGRPEVRTIARRR